MTCSHNTFYFSLFKYLATDHNKYLANMLYLYITEKVTQKVDTKNKG